MLGDLIGDGGVGGFVCDAAVFGDERVDFGLAGVLGADLFEAVVEGGEPVEDAGDAAAGVGGGEGWGVGSGGAVGVGLGCVFGGVGGLAHGCVWDVGVGCIGGVGLGIVGGVVGWGAVRGVAWGAFWGGWGGGVGRGVGGVVGGLRGLGLGLGLGVVGGCGLVDFGVGGGSGGVAEDEAFGVWWGFDFEGGGCAGGVVDWAEVVEGGADGGEVFVEESFEGCVDAGVVHVEGSESGASCEDDGVGLFVESGVSAEDDGGGVFGVGDAEPLAVYGVGLEDGAGLECCDGVPDDAGGAAEFGGVGDGDEAWFVEGFGLCGGGGGEGEERGGGGEGAGEACLESGGEWGEGEVHEWLLRVVVVCVRGSFAQDGGFVTLGGEGAVGEGRYGIGGGGVGRVPFAAMSAEHVKRAGGCVGVWGGIGRGRPGLLVGLAGGVLVGLWGCAGPFEYEYERASSLRAAVEAAVERDLVESGAGVGGAVGEARLPEREERDLGFSEERLAELEMMAGPGAEGEGAAPELGPDLLGDESSELVRMGLREAVLRAVSNNLDVRVASFGPAIDEQRITEAEAAFDFVAFGGVDWLSEDSPAQRPNFGGAEANQSETVTADAGLRRLLTTGGTAQVSTTYTYSDDRSTGFSLEPDPANRAGITARLEQPLLRGFGRDVNLAQVRTAQNLRMDAVQELRLSVLRTIEDVETAYWQLRFAERDLGIRRRLLERGLEVQEVLRRRLEAEFDVTPAEFSDAVATVESRRGEIISAQNRLRRASDRLKLLIADPEYPVAGETLLLTSDRVLDEPVAFSLLDSAAAAVGSRPEIARAALATGLADINLDVAENGLLPDLDLVLQADWAGLDENGADAYEDVFDGRFLSTLVGLEFSRALGNRREEAEFRRRRLERLQTLSEYQRVARVVLDEVKGALRDVETNYRLIAQSRTSRLAAAENLRTLLVEKDLTRALTADFLDLEFTRQELLAQAELGEARALVDYAISIARLDAATVGSFGRFGIEVEAPDADALMDREPLMPLVP